MRVLYVLSSTGLFGGATKSFLTMLKGVRQSGVETYAVVPDSKDLCVELQNMGIKVYVLPLRRNCYPKYATAKEKLLFLPVTLSRIFNNLRVVRQLKNIIKDNRIDLVHTNSSIVSVGIQAAMCTGVPHVCHVREYADKDFDMHYMPTRHRWEKYLCGNNCYTISITKDIRSYHGFDENPRAEVIYNGISPVVDTKPACPKQPYFLFAGRIEPAKGVDQLIDAYVAYFRQVGGAALQLWLAGAEVNTHCSDRLRQTLETAGVPMEKVSFLGARNDISALMQQAVATVVPSRYEAFGRCMPEAMLNGCLVIARNTGGTREQLENGLEMHGKEIAIRYDTTSELAKCLVDVASHTSDYYDEMTERAFDTVNKLYSNQAYVAKILDLYHSILHEQN